MARTITVAAAQMGPIPHSATPGAPAVREAAMARLRALLAQAAAQGAQLVVFPELALTTFFPRALLPESAVAAAVEEEVERGESVERSEDNKNIPPHLAPLFAQAQALGIDVSIGYAERWTAADGTTTDYNTAVYYSAAAGGVVHKYRKVHLPGRTTLLPAGSAQQLEKHYFAPGDLGFEAFRVPGLVEAAKAGEPVIGGSTSPSSSSPPGDPILGLLICNDRRWCEAWRCYGLQGVELVLCGFNTTDYKPQDAGWLGGPAEQEALALLHHHISVQSGSYTNACFSVSVAKAGDEDPGAPGGGLIAGTVIYDPLGRKVAETTTKDDELLVATLDLDLCRRPKATIFNFAAHRRVEHYRRLVDQVGVVEPPLLLR